jgi:hypothetical protein
LQANQYKLIELETTNFDSFGPWFEDEEE